MADMKLCEQTDVADWLSDAGLLSRMDDDRDGANAQPELDRIDRFIVRASAVIRQYLAERYKANEYAGAGTPPANTPPIVKHYAAVIAAYYVCIRRNLPVSAELGGEYQRVIDEMKAIRDGTISLGDVPDSLETIPCVSNFHVDGNFRSSKIRVVPATSTGKRPNPPTKNNVEPYIPNPLWE